MPLLNAGNSFIYIIDVREVNGTASYVTGHIAGAHNIPFQNMSAVVATGLIPQNKIMSAPLRTRNGMRGQKDTAEKRCDKNSRRHGWLMVSEASRNVVQTQIEQKVAFQPRDLSVDVKTTNIWKSGFDLVAKD